MGSGDLNLLKSWNPKLMKNRKKVWETEQDLITEQQKLNTRLKEIEKERELNELLNESSKDKPETLKNDLAVKKSGLEWMYQDAKLSDEKEDYLLGKKKLDSSIPVSYTHLDVYKRQILNQTHRFPHRQKLLILTQARQLCLRLFARLEC